MAGEKKNATHQDGTSFEGPVDSGNPHAKRPADKKQGDMSVDTAVSSKDPGTLFPSGKVAEEIEALFAGIEGLSEGFASKAATILEGALSERTVFIREQIQAEFDAKLETSLEEAVAGYDEKIDSYLNYVVEQFMAENKLAIDSGIKIDVAEQVMASVGAIVEASGCTLPEDKIDVSEALAEELKETESKLNEEIEKSLALTEKVRKFEIKEAFSELATGLSDASREKLGRLSENLSFSNVEDYKARVTVLKESISDKPSTPPTKTEQLIEEIVITSSSEKKVPDSRMQAYLQAARG